MSVKRWIPDNEGGEFHSMTEAIPEELDEWTFVHYSDYEKLVVALRDVLHFTSNVHGAREIAEAALLSNGEEL
jgi:hypothetical protein